MTTPNKLSLKKKKNPGVSLVSDCIVITDSDEEKENNDKIGNAGSFRTKYRTPRRESTILAGNLTMLDQSSVVVDPDQQVNVTIRRSKGKVGRGSKRDSKELTPLYSRPPMPRLSMASMRTEDLTIPQNKSSEDHFVSPKSSIVAAGRGLITEDESGFYSCQGSPTKMDVGMQNTLMTDITTKSEKERRKVPKVPTVQVPVATSLSTPSHGKIITPKKPQGSTIKAAAFFSFTKRLQGDGVTGQMRENAVLAGGSDSDDSPRQQMVPARLKFTGKLERTRVASSDDQVTEDEGVLGGGGDSNSCLVSDSDDDVPLVQLGRDFLSDTQFGKIVNWVQHSPFSSKLELSKASNDTSSSISQPNSDQEIESLLKSDPEDGDVRPSWAAPLPRSNRSEYNQGTSKAGGSWNRTGTTKTGTSGLDSQGTSKAGGSWNRTGTTKTETSGLDSQGTSKAWGSWNKTGTTMTGTSQGTSKAGGALFKSGTDQSSGEPSETTSKKGGNWSRSCSVENSLIFSFLFIGLVIFYCCQVFWVEKD